VLQILQVLGAFQNHYEREEYPGITSNKIDNIVDGIKIILLFESIKLEEAKMVSYKTFTK